VKLRIPTIATNGTVASRMRRFAIVIDKPFRITGTLQVGDCSPTAVGVAVFVTLPAGQ
jgi:hypothetical protein